MKTTQLRNLSVGLLFLIAGTSIAQAQILHDKNAVKELKRDMDLIYNADFKQAHKLYDSISKSYPDSPVVFLLHGIITYWENYPLLSTSPLHNSFENDMRRSISMAQNNSNPEFASENLLSNLCARGMLLTYYSANNETMKVISLTTSTYGHIMKVFNSTYDYADLYYFSGIYNYYREAYPEKHPVYKYVAFPLRHGNMKLGLKELKIAAQNSIFLEAESNAQMALIYTSMERNYEQALYFSKLNYEKYPCNKAFEFSYLQNLLMARHYDQAEKLLRAVSTDNLNTYFKAQLSILNGILQEKKYGDSSRAEIYYTQGIDSLSPYGAYADDYTEIAHAGLKNISQAKVNKEIIRINRSLSPNFAGF